MNRISKRYALAIIELAKEKIMVDLYYENLNICTKAVNENNTLFEILANPENAFKVKKAVLQSLFGEKVKAEILNLLYILIQNERLNYLNDIFKDYEYYMQKYKDAIDVEAFSVVPIEKKDMDKIKAVLAKKYNTQRVNIINSINKDLIAGFKLVIGNEVIDRSVLGMIDEMKNRIVSR